MSKAHPPYGRRGFAHGCNSRKGSEHPLGEAIVNGATSRKIDIPAATSLRP